MNPFRTFDDIEVKLVGAISNPYELSVATARTCYSSKGVIYPEQVSQTEKAIELRDKIAESTLEAGHLTTRQHAHFVFALSGVSRQFIWSFLHSHPFYNSEQVSQRYVRVKRENFIVPPLSEKALEIYESVVALQMSTYEKLIEELKPQLAQEYYERFPSRKKYADKWNGSIDKRAFEVARYVLGVGTTAYLYHTVSMLTLLRYAKACQLFEVPVEQKIVIGKMIESIKAWDPYFEKELRDPMPIEKTLEYAELKHWSEMKTQNVFDFIHEFDEGLSGNISKLAGATSNAEEILAHAYRVSLGIPASALSKEEALEKLLNPKHNTLLADTLNISTLDKLSQILHHVQFSFHKKISHTADSQDQRHRMTPSSRPLLFLHYSGKPDYILPYALSQSGNARDLFETAMEKTFEGINKLLDLGVSSEFAFYLLPNAYPIRMVSSGDLHGLHHKWKLRSCYNSQEEIFRATIEEISQVHEKFPLIAKHLLAPCYLRKQAKVNPYCPEGDRFCGLPVWNYKISDYERKSI